MALFNAMIRFQATLKPLNITQRLVETSIILEA